MNNKMIHYSVLLNGIREFGIESSDPEEAAANVIAHVKDMDVELCDLSHVDPEFPPGYELHVAEEAEVGVSYGPLRVRMYAGFHDETGLFSGHSGPAILTVDLGERIAEPVQRLVN